MSSLSIVERIYEDVIHKRINYVLHERADMQRNVQKIRSESSEHMWKTTGAFINSWRIKIALESYFEKHAQEIWERILGKTTLLNMYNPTLKETILKVLREQFKEDDQMNTAEEIAGSIPETSLECEQILKERRGFWWMSAMDICLKIWC